MEKLAESFNGKVGESGSVLLGEGIDEFEGFVHPNWESDADDAFRGRGPGADHDFFPNGDIFGSG